NDPTPAIRAWHAILDAAVHQAAGDAIAADLAQSGWSVLGAVLVLLTHEPRNWPALEQFLRTGWLASAWGALA
ncbi:MAG TPA: hypothetical protein VJ011_08440, partial [Steroidobacteraceae bacterium]|nr:hypothetical protein [Steroidobacteraceae bacterium]